MYEEKRFRARARQLHLYVPGKVGGGKPRFPYHFHARLAFWSPGLEVATFSNTWPSSLQFSEICTLWQGFSISGLQLLRYSKLERFATCSLFLSDAIVRTLRENVFAALVFSLRFGFCSEFQGFHTLVCNYW